MKESLRKVAEMVFPHAEVVVDPFHVVSDSNKRMDEARRIERKDTEENIPDRRGEARRRGEG